MEIMGVVKRPMMEYSFPTADGTISSIAKPVVERNNFEIKPAIIQIIWSSVQFYGLPDEDPNKHLVNFFEICDTFKFKGVSNDAVRLRFFLSLCDTAKDWLQSLPAANRATIDAAAGGTIMKKLPSEAFNIINEIATNLYSYGQERADKRTAYIHSIDVVSALSGQISALTQTVNNLGAAMWNGAPIGPCGACGQMGHWSQDCKVGNQFSIHKDANFVSHDGKSNFNPYSNTYNLGWHSHPNFSWSANQQWGLTGHHQPRQQHQQEKKKAISKICFPNSSPQQTPDSKIKMHASKVKKHRC
ncbi:UNVERIFIED_CONTAM: hypothetical protein Slati_2427300 [Sesamum latifolium]|uniref:CCHC-type domain-containing protein n=1 Tax=Sesamum latifolium TaxID=2727402 RepID=A0AAW2WDQ6_9LAMI